MASSKLQVVLEGSVPALSKISAHQEMRLPTKKFQHIGKYAIQFVSPLSRLCFCVERLNLQRSDLFWRTDYDQSVARVQRDVSERVVKE